VEGSAAALSSRWGPNVPFSQDDVGGAKEVGCLSKSEDGRNSPVLFSRRRTSPQLPDGRKTRCQVGQVGGGVLLARDLIYQSSMQSRVACYLLAASLGPLPPAATMRDQ
jgi:hypothetical protein